MPISRHAARNSRPPSSTKSPGLPGRGWHVFFGVVSIIAGMVVVAWPFDSIAVLAVVTGVWAVFIGIYQIVWALAARKNVDSLNRGLEQLRSAVR